MGIFNTITEYRRWFGHHFKNKPQRELASRLEHAAIMVAEKHFQSKRKSETRRTFADDRLSIETARTYHGCFSVRVSIYLPGQWTQVLVTGEAFDELWYLGHVKAFREGHWMGHLTSLFEGVTEDVASKQDSDRKEKLRREAEQFLAVDDAALFPEYVKPVATGMAI